jgi:phage terminase small subunit
MKCQELSDSIVRWGLRSSMAAKNRHSPAFEQLARVCFSDVRKLCNPDGSLKKVNELDADTAAAVASFEVDEVEIGDKVVRRTIKVKLWDKNAALEKAFRHLGLYNRDNTQRSENLSLQVVLVGKP